MNLTELRPDPGSTRAPRVPECAPHSVVPLLVPQLKFTHAGLERTLNKHPAVQTALRQSTTTIAAALKTPWYLRAKLAGRERPFKLAVNDKDAIRAAKDLLRGSTEQPSAFADFLAARDLKRGVTLGTLADQWVQAGLPFSKTRQRDPAAAIRLHATLTRALQFWSHRVASAVSQSVVEDFVVWRRNNVRAGTHYTGDTSADRELAALSSLCQWAIRLGHLKENPFGTRETFAQVKRHCYEAMPDNDEQFHLVLDWFFRPDGCHQYERAVAGAWLACCALSGLRPGEPLFLIQQPVSRRYPQNFAAAVPGLLYFSPDRQWRMKVRRLKRGQNPAVLLHPVLRDFLCTWRTWLRSHCPGSAPAPGVPASASSAVPLFAGVTQDRLEDHLKRACRDLGLSPMKPHGFGRAYYVRVRRSQGADDATIAGELGQASGGSIIRKHYGDPMDPVGGHLHNWLPGRGLAPAWHHLSKRPDAGDTSLIRPIVGKIR